MMAGPARTKAAAVPTIPETPAAVAVRAVVPTQAPIPERERIQAPTPERIRELIPVRTQARIQALTQARIPELTQALIPELTQALIPEPTQALIPVPTQLTPLVLVVVFRIRVLSRLCRLRCNRDDGRQ
jgi:hypothetical protein